MKFLDSVRDIAQQRLEVTKEKSDAYAPHRGWSRVFSEEIESKFRELDSFDARTSAMAHSYMLNWIDANEHMINSMKPTEVSVLFLDMVNSLSANYGKIHK